MKRSPPLSLDALEFSKTAGAQALRPWQNIRALRRGSLAVPATKDSAGPRFPSGRIAQVLTQSLRDSRRQGLENSTDGPTRQPDRQTLLQAGRLCLRSFPARELIAAKLPLPEGNKGSRRLPSEADTLIFPLPFKFYSQSARLFLFSHPSVTAAEAPPAFSPQRLSAERPGRQEGVWLQQMTGR